MYFKELHMYFSNNKSPFWIIFKVNYLGIKEYNFHYILPNSSLDYNLIYKNCMHSDIKEHFKKYLFHSGTDFKPRLHMHFYQFNYTYQMSIQPNWWWKMYNITLEWNRLFSFELRYDNNYCMNQNCFDFSYGKVINGTYYNSNSRYWKTFLHQYFNEYNIYTNNHFSCLLPTQVEHNNYTYCMDYEYVIFIKAFNSIMCDIPTITKEFISTILIG